MASLHLCAFSVTLVSALPPLHPQPDRNSDQRKIFASIRECLRAGAHQCRFTDENQNNGQYHGQHRIEKRDSWERASHSPSLHMRLSYALHSLYSAAQRTDRRPNGHRTTDSLVVITSPEPHTQCNSDQCKIRGGTRKSFGATSYQ